MDKQSFTSKTDLLKVVRKQLEFYFSDANLTKDRFLAQTVYKSDGGYVDIEAFLKFNKIKNLTTDLKVIRKAIKSSDLLELDEDKLKVRRIKRLKAKQGNSDECTVYVEGFSLDTSHDWLKDLFSVYGEVAYVSLPKFHDGKLKGFGFIEFASAKYAQGACDDFGNSFQKRSEDTNNCDGSVATYRNMERLRSVRGEIDSKVMKLRILSKREWKRLKNKYLALQKANAAKVKDSLGMTLHPEPMDGCLDPCYSTSHESSSIKPDPYAFVPNLIWKIELQGPSEDWKNLKCDIRGLSGVAFVEIDDKVAFVRCADQQSSMGLETGLTQFGKCSLLLGEEELEYWRKIRRDRELKLNTKSRSKSHRQKVDPTASKLITVGSGQDAKHIRFD